MCVDIMSPPLYWRCLPMEMLVWARVTCPPRVLSIVLVVTYYTCHNINIHTATLRCLTMSSLNTNNNVHIGCGTRDLGPSSNNISRNSCIPVCHSIFWVVCLLKVLLEAKISILRNIVITDQVIKLLLIRTRGSFIDCDFCECDYQNGISMFAEIRSFSIIHQHHYYCYAPWWRNNLNFLLNV